MEAFVRERTQYEEFKTAGLGEVRKRTGITAR